MSQHSNARSRKQPLQDWRMWERNFTGFQSVLLPFKKAVFIRVVIW